MTDIVDLRVGDDPLSSPRDTSPRDTSSPADVSTDGTDPGGPPGGASRARTAVVATVAGLMVCALLVVFLLPLSGRQRQQHRADEYQTAQSRLVAGDPAFVLQIPAIGLNTVAVKGAEPSLLRGGPGWREGSAAPGQGNTVVLGHSTLWEYSFGRLADLRGGARVYLRTRDGRVYRYKVNRVRTVPDGRTSVMDPGGPVRLTLVTSAGGPLDSSRTVVQAQADGPQPEVPARSRVKLVRGDQGSFDERGPGGLVLLLSGLLVVAIGAFGFVELRRRYQLPTVLVVAGPAIALGIVLVLFNLDAFLPITF